MDEEVLCGARAWLEAGWRVHLFTVVRTWGSAPRQAGAMMALREDGHVLGSVSGGCVEDELSRRARDGALPEGCARLVFGVAADDAAHYGLPCGGTLALVVERLRRDGWLSEVIGSMQAHRLVRRTLDLRTGVSRLEPAAPGSGPSISEDRLVAVYGPRWRLLIIGANQTALALARMAAMLEFQVWVCDPRKDYLAQWSDDKSQRLSCMPDDAVLEISTDVRTAVVALTHDPKLDDMALLEALRSPAFYVGALGSRANQARRRERLALMDMQPAEIERLRGPVGLPIGSRTPAEIAVAIAAELVQWRQAPQAQRQQRGRDFKEG